MILGKRRRTRAAANTLSYNRYQGLVTACFKMQINRGTDPNGRKEGML